MGITIMIFVSLSLLVFVGLLAEFNAQKLTHATWQSDPSRNCGPLQNGSYGEEYLERYLNSNIVTRSLEHLAHNVPLNLLLVIIMFRTITKNKAFWNMKEMAANQNIE